MKILLDECVDQRLRFLFSGHDCETAAYAKLAGLKNGALLAAAEAADFEVIITTDQEIPYQQNLAWRKIAIVVLRAPTNRLADLRPFIPATIEALDLIKPSQVIRVAEESNAVDVEYCALGKNRMGRGAAMGAIGGPHDGSSTLPRLSAFFVTAVNTASGRFCCVARSSWYFHFGLGLRCVAHAAKAAIPSPST